MAKGLLVPLDPRLKTILDLPHTISFVIRKRIQIDNLNELPKEKRPTDKILWEGTPEELDEWLDVVLEHKKGQSTDVELDLKDIEK